MQEQPQNRRNFLKKLLNIGASFAGLQILTQNLNRLTAQETEQLFANNLIDNATENNAAAQTLWKKSLCEGYGALVADKAKIMNLPRGFSYKIIMRAGDKLSDGLLSAGRPDGMCAFAGTNGKVILVRNHELSSHQVNHSPFGKDNKLLKKAKKAAFFDYGFGKTPHLGGCSTIIYDESAGKVLKSFVSLAGTSRNCAGGLVNKNYWLTCEEDFQPQNDKNEQSHGYVFIQKATETPSLSPARPIKAMGRFNHEAAAQDEKTGIIYLTEDRHEGLFYRFIPIDRNDLHKGGKLEALCFSFKQKMDTRNWKSTEIKPNVKYSVRWMPLDNVCPVNDNLRYRGFKSGAACFARGEGIWASSKGVYFACTNGGKLKSGQIFKYIPSPYEGTKKEKNTEYRAKLELFCEPNNHNLLKYADNLTIAPNGDLVLVEDNHHPRIVGITPQGKFYVIAENIGYKSEMAGVCFSPSGKTLFVNIQEAGLTLAIKGSWASRKG